MYYPYVTSTLSIRCQAPISYSFNDYRFNGHLISSSQSCCCVCCCTNYIYTNPLNPRFVCGSRQSSLIHWSASRRLLILPGPDPCCFRSPVQDPCRKCCCGCVKGRGFGGETRRDSGEGKFGRRVSEGRSCDFETAEMMLSLLIEEVGEECYGVRERDYSSSRRLEFVKKGSESDGFRRKEKTKKKNVGSGLLKSSSRSKYEVSSIAEAKNRQKEDRKREDEEIFSSGKHRQRKSGSTSASYYTCASLGEESESDSEIHVRNEAYREESGEGYKRDSKESGNVVYKGEIKENLGRREGVVGSHKMIESDWRKKTEKKLDEVAIEEVCETSHHRGSTSHKQFDNFDDKSKFMISDSGTRQQYSWKSDQAIGGSESKPKQKQFMEVCKDDVKAVSSSREQFSVKVDDCGETVYGKGGKSNVAGSFGLVEKHERVKVDDRVSQRDGYRLSAEQSNQVSQIEDVNVKRTNISHLQYEDKKKRQEDRFSVALSSEEDTEKRFYLKSEEDSRQMDLRRKFQQTTKTSDDCDSQRDDFRSSTEQSNQVSQIQDTNVRRTNISQAQYEDKVKKREDQSSVISSSVQDTGRHYKLKSEEDLRQLDSRRKLRLSAEISDDHVSRKDDYRLGTEQFDQVSQIQDINLRTNISHEHYEDRVKRREDQSSLISSLVQDTENIYYLQSEEDSRQMDSRRKLEQSTEISNLAQDVQFGRQAISRKESAKGSQEMSTIMLSQSSGKQVSNSYKTSENRIGNQETYSSMVVKSTEESKKRTERIDNRVLRIGSKKETGGTSHKASSLQASLVLETMPTVGDESDSQAIVMTPESQIPRTSSQNGLNSDDALSTGTEPTAPPLQHEILEGSAVFQTQTSDDPLTSISHEDALGSAHRFQKSSSKIVGEFLEKVTHEVSSSHRQIEESTSKSTSKEEMVLKGRTHEQKSSSEYGDADFKSKDRESRRSSGSSGVKGPSDEIWDEVAPSTLESVDTQTQVPERTNPSQSTVVKRPGRSLWNVFSDIIRLRWSSQSKISTLKSGVRNSPNQSNSSEAWFSGRDRDEASEENMNKGNKNVSRESIPTPTESQGEGYSSSSSKDKMSSSKTLIGSTTPKGSSSASTEENLKMGGSTMMETSVAMPSLQVQRSPNADDVTEFDQRTTVSASGSLIGTELVTISTPINVKRSEGVVGGDVKRRMLQRTNQVIKDRFDEWEEAFTLETEQRKIDEAFMREALLEARKAGDMWEVPVGAVLVQHGKIIARGYNLVEELRDSTAHAEMICIREASNQLRTWRLAETTLYVTLEPCPMCAGAILQARVETVVWGAPNKLLGADGSWIRLFPGGGEGGVSSEISDKPPAPVHPFHPKITIRRGVLGTECADVMQQFFQLRRRKKDKKQLPDAPPTPPSSLLISNHPTKILTRMHDAFHFMFCL